MIAVVYIEGGERKPLMPTIDIRVVSYRTVCRCCGFVVFVLMLSVRIIRAHQPRLSSVGR